MQPLNALGILGLLVGALLGCSAEIEDDRPESRSGNLRIAQFPFVYSVNTYGSPGIGNVLFVERDLASVIVTSRPAEETQGEIPTVTRRCSREVRCFTAPPIVLPIVYGASASDIRNYRSPVLVDGGSVRLVGHNAASNCDEFETAMNDGWSQTYKRCHPVGITEVHIYERGILRRSYALMSHRGIP